MQKRKPGQPHRKWKQAARERFIKLRAENERLRDLLAFNGITPEAHIESAKRAAKKRKG